MKQTALRVDVPSMDLLDLPHRAGTGDHRIFYLSSCESSAGIDAHDSNLSSRRSSVSSNCSLDVCLPTPVSASRTNTFLHVLKRLHCITLRRKKHGRYRSIPSSLHLFFKKHQHHSSVDLSEPANDFCKSSSTSQCPSTPTDTATTTTPTTMVKKACSCQQLSLTGANTDKNHNSKMDDSPLRRSCLRRNRTSDKTVSEDNNTNTLSSVDLAITPQPHPIVTVTDSTSSAIAVQETGSANSKRVSDRIPFITVGTWVKGFFPGKSTVAV